MSADTVEVSSLVTEFQTKQTDTERTIIFCSTHNICSNILKFIKQSLGDGLSEPKASFDVPKYRVNQGYSVSRTKEWENFA